MSGKLWKWGGVALLLMVVWDSFTTPMQPGWVASEVDKSDANAWLVELSAAGHPLVDGVNDNTAGFQVIFKSESAALCAEVISVEAHKLVCRLTPPDTLPRPSLDAFVMTPGAGSLMLRNAVSVAGAVKGVPHKNCEIGQMQPSTLPATVPFQPNILETIRNLMFHVPMWFAMFFIMSLSFVSSLLYMRTGDIKYDQRADAASRTGLLFGVLGLITGSVWARFTWGAWWVADPQLNGALVTVLVYTGYRILRAATGDDDRVPRLAAAYNVFAFILLVVLLMILPKYNVSLHPGKDGSPGFNTYDLDNTLRSMFYPAVIGWGMLGYWIYTLGLRMIRVHRQLLNR
ncbi:MAG: cytochrome c biogenesis protein CcsA [Flavobacteriales bacterium]|nr:cytochrome c biogenesis protein CcsA [Flavobacteriales bacterium]